MTIPSAVHRQFTQYGRGARWFLAASAEGGAPAPMVAHAFGRQFWGGEADLLALLERADGVAEREFGGPGELYPTPFTPLPRWAVEAGIEEPAWCSCRGTVVSIRPFGDGGALVRLFVAAIGDSSDGPARRAAFADQLFGDFPEHRGVPLSEDPIATEAREAAEDAAYAELEALE